MSLDVESDPVPIAADESGTLRVGGTRVTLDTVVDAFNEGLSAEEIAQQLPVLALADVYAVVAYYLRHRETLDVYLVERETAARQLQSRIARELPSSALRARLLARRS